MLRWSSTAKCLAATNLAVLPDSGSVTGYQVPAPANDSKHHAAPWHDDYSPQIAVYGDNAYVVWAGLDASGVRQAYFRRFSGNGTAMGPLIAASTDVPDRGIISRTEVSVAAAGSDAYVIPTVKNRLSEDGLDRRRRTERSLIWRAIFCARMESSF